MNATSSLEIKSVESLKYINDGKPYIKKFTFDAVLASVDVYTVQAKVALEEGTSLEKMPPSDLPVGKPVLTDD